jgi:hypothetical protein
MSKALKLKRLALTLGIAIGVSFGVKSVSFAEPIKKLHPAPQLILNSAQFNDSNEATTSTVDLSGGDLDKCSFIVQASSAEGTATLTYTIQVSADGGTTWGSTSNTISVATSATSGAAVWSYAADKPTNPGTKLRLTSSLTGSTSYYHLKVYALPNVN